MCHRSGSVNLCKSIQHTHTDWVWFVPLSVYMCLLYAPGPMAPLYDLCLQPARIPVGHVLHTDQQEEGDVEHVDVRSPPHTEQEGHVELHTEF